MPAGYRESEDLEMTRVEKLLVFGLVAFLLIGMFWVLDQTEGLIPRPVLRTEQRAYGTVDRTQSPIEDQLGIPALRKRVDAQRTVANRANETLRARETAFHDAERAYLFRREEYRTAMEAERTAPQTIAAYRSSRSLYTARTNDWKAARAEANRAQSRLNALQNRLDALTSRAQKIYDRRVRSREVWLFFIRFGYAAALILLGWMAWQRGRAVRWRYLSLLTAFLVAAVLQLLFLLFRYCWELLADVAQLGVSVLGVLGCGLALVALKRYLFSPERVARARLAAHACPYCSTPFESGQAYCWDCGRPLLEPCPSCGAPHLRYSPHCPSCGRAIPVPEPAAGGP